MRRPKQRQPISLKRHIFPQTGFRFSKKPLLHKFQARCRLRSCSLLQASLGQPKKATCAAPPARKLHSRFWNHRPGGWFIECGRRGALFRGVAKDAPQIRKGSVFACAPGLQKMDAGLEKWHSLLCRRKARPSKGRGHRKLPVHLRQIRERRRRDTRCGIPPADEHAAAQYAPIASRPPPLN